MTLQKKIEYWLPTILWAVVIFSFSSGSSIPTSQVIWQDFAIKKFAHFFVYFVLAILIYRSLHHTARFSTKELILLTFTIAVLYAVSDEFHQSFTPGREPKFRDVMIDAFGIGSSLYLIVKGKFKRIF